MVNVKQSTLLKDEQKKEIVKRLEEDIDSIRAGALLHDIMHIPFAHTLEDENNILERGDKSKRIDFMIDKLKDELDKIDPSPPNLKNLTNYRIFSFSDSTEFEKAMKLAKTLLEDTRKILWTIALHDVIEKKARAEKEAGTPKDKIYQKVKQNIEQQLKVKILEAERYYISDIIGNTISADLLSYILRDPEFTGIETKPGGWYRLLDYLEILEDDVGRQRLVIRLTKSGEWRQDAFSTIIRMLNVRYDLTEQVTYHHAKLSASAMMGKIAQLCSISESNDLYEIGDEGFFKLLEEKIEEVKNGNIENKTREDAIGAEKLLESLRCRRLHKRFHVIYKRDSPKRFDLSERYSKPEERLKLERRIERLGLTPGSVIIFCPARGGTLKEAETLVTYERVKPDGNLEPITLPLNSPDCLEFLKEERGESTAMKVRNVARQYEDLWTLYVFVDSAIIPIYGYEIKRILNDELGSCPSFDRSSLESMQDYKLSRTIVQKVVEMRVPELDRKEVLKKIPAAIAQISGRDRKGTSVEWISTNLESIVETAKELAMQRTFL